MKLFIMTGKSVALVKWEINQEDNGDKVHFFGADSQASSFRFLYSEKKNTRPNFGQREMLNVVQEILKIDI